MGASARWRQDREAWYVHYRVGEKRWSKRIGGAEAEADAKAIAEAFNEALAEKAAESPLFAGGAIPFDRLAREWWDAHQPTMPNSTRRSREPIVFGRLIPFFGSEDSRRIDLRAITQCADHFATQQRHARETVELTGSVLALILSWGSGQGLLDPQMSEGVRRTFRKVAAARCPAKARVEVWSWEEVRQILQVASARNSSIYDPLLFAAQTGARRGEILALEWEDVDLDRRRVQIRQSHSAGQTKTTKADRQRTVDLADEVLEMLTVRRRGRGARAQVFLTSEGRPWTDAGFSCTWARIRAHAVDAYAVRKLKFHCLRHTYASLALASGQDPAWIAEQIGDRLETFLERYAHVMPRQDRSLDWLTLERAGGRR